MLKDAFTLTAFLVGFFAFDVLLYRVRSLWGRL